MTPSDSSRWMRFQHGVDDRPTREPISATDSAAFSCRTARIFRSMASIVANNLPNLRDLISIYRILFQIKRQAVLAKAGISGNGSMLSQKRLDFRPGRRPVRAAEAAAFDAGDR